MDGRIGVTVGVVLASAGCSLSSPLSSHQARDSSKQDVQTLVVDPAPNTETVPNIRHGTAHLPRYTLFGEEVSGCRTGQVGLRAFVWSAPYQICLVKGATLYMTLSPPGAGRDWSSPVLAGNAVVAQRIRHTASELDERLHAVSAGVTMLRTTVGGPGAVDTIRIRIRVEAR